MPRHRRLIPPEQLKKCEFNVFWPLNKILGNPEHFLRDALLFHASAPSPNWSQLSWIWTGVSATTRTTDYVSQFGCDEAVNWLLWGKRRVCHTDEHFLFKMLQVKTSLCDEKWGCDIRQFDLRGHWEVGGHDSWTWWSNWITSHLLVIISWYKALLAWF